MKRASTLFRISSSLLSVRSYNSLSSRKSLSETLLSINHGAMTKTMSSSSSIHTSVPRKTAPWLSKTSPWLMLPPTFTGENEMIYQFYVLGENRVMTLQRAGEQEFWGDHDYSILGSSHGWLFLFHKESCDLILSNPLYGRHVRLPSIRTLPGIPKRHLERGFRSLHDLILSSSSPDDDDECRAVVTFGPHRRLAFCCPNSSKGPLEWTVLGDKADYDACVYSAKQKLFFCFRDGYYQGIRENKDPCLEAWDLKDPHSPRMIPMPPLSFDNTNYPIAYRSEQEHKQKDHRAIWDAILLAVAEPTGQLFHVRRFTKDWVGPDGYYTKDEYYGPKIGIYTDPPYTTLGFDVHRYDPESGSLVYMDRSLDGLALFIGSNNGFGLPAADFPELKPDSIYYTEPPMWRYGCHHVDDYNYDAGIFNYRDESFAPCFYPVDVQSSVRVSGPKWFTPTPLVRFPFLVQNDDSTLSYGSSCSSIPPTKSHSQNLSRMINANVPKTKKRSSSTSPWLMLPPVFGGNNKLDMLYQFYSLGLDRVLSVPKRSIPSYEDDNLEIVGSSRGWLALFNKENYCDLFLSNPLTGRHVKLPSLDSLSSQEKNVDNVVISSDDPFEEDCRVLITCTPNDRLAFCCPGHTNPEWTRIGHPSTSFQFESLTYSSRQKLFLCAKGPSGRTDHIEAWDLHDPLSPKMVPLPPVTVDEDNYPVASHSELESELKHLCGYDAVFLVLSEHTEELFQVRQYVLHRMGPDGSFADDVYYEGNSDSDESPHKTVGFDVHKYDPKTGKMVYMDRSLGGLALFVGPQEGFALPADEYQGLKPNSIYYTDMYYSDYENRYGGHDIGIFNYENETFSPCYYPCDLKSMMTKIVPNPIWFRPSPCAFI